MARCFQPVLRAGGAATLFIVTAVGIDYRERLEKNENQGSGLEFLESTDFSCFIFAYSVSFAVVKNCSELLLRFSCLNGY